MKCTKCSKGDMIQRNGKNGKFMACDQYPDCKNTESVSEDDSNQADVIARYEVVPDRDTKIIRQTCIKAACDLCDADSDIVSILACATEFEKWVLRPTQ